MARRFWKSRKKGQVMSSVSYACGSANDAQKDAASLTYQRIGMREVSHEDGGLEQTVLHALELSFGVKVFEVLPAAS
jgi:hypothetical protein